MAPGLSPLRLFVSSIIVVVGNELGFDSTIAGGVFVKEQARNGLDPQRPSLPEKLFRPNFRTMASGNSPYSSLLERLSCLSCGNDERDGGISPESSLF